jgi:hypothetical protein
MLIYKDGIVAHYKEIFRNTSFSASGPSDEFLAENGAKKVTVFKAHDRATQKLVSSDPYEEDGIIYTVSVVDKTAEEIAADANAKVAQIRSQRNQLLSATDWTQVLDAPIDRTAWATYRQALRDITSQEGFPASVQWPNDPNYVAPAGNID